MNNYKKLIMIIAITIVVAGGIFVWSRYQYIFPNSVVQVPQLTSRLSPLATPTFTAQDDMPTANQASRFGFFGCLIFVSDFSGSLEIYKMISNTNIMTQLTTSGKTNLTPVWSPDGSEIAFASMRSEDETFQLYIMDADGGNQKRLLDERLGGDNTNPSWSPSGKNIVFQSNQDVNNDLSDDNYDLYIADLEAGDVHRLALSTKDETSPSWSPDGKKIAFLSERTGQDELYMIDADDFKITQLTSLPMLKSDVSWLRDGKKIVFSGDGDIYRVDVESKKIDKMVELKDSIDATPVQGPEETIIYSSDYSNEWHLYLHSYNLNKLEPIQLTYKAKINRYPNWFPCKN